MVAGLMRPTSAVVCLIFPLLVTSFFEGPALGLALCPIFLLVFSRGPVHTIDVIMLTALCLFAVLIAGITSNKYRQVFAQATRCATRLEVARAVQKSMEPPPCLIVGPLKVLTRMEVCHDLGGDFVGVRMLADGGVLVLVGDVQGKGPQSALTAAYLEGVFHHCCMAGVERPEDILKRMHELLESKDGGRFVTAMCLRFCPRARFVRVANAGHPLPIVVAKQPRMAGKTGLVLGVAGLFELGLADLELDADERLLLMSDGCYEEEGVTASLTLLLQSPGVGMEDILGWLDRNTGEHRDDRTTVLLERLRV
jgi:serine phosphatase RsbU (regulator of sigma subunit)